MRTTHFSLEGLNDSPALSGEELRQRYAQYENIYWQGADRLRDATSQQVDRAVNKQFKTGSLTVWDKTSKLLINVTLKRGKQGHHTLSTVPLPQ